MAYISITTTNARRDIQQAIDWENMRKPGLGEYFLSDFEAKITDLEITPALGSIRYENVRITFTKIFPYNIHYVIDDTKQLVIILRVLSQYKEPIY
jgi:hypothetical protein